MTAEHYLSTELRDGCLQLRLNRADKANALTVSMMEDLKTALDNACGDAAVHAILITGAGDKVFSGGVDIREQPADGDMAVHRARRSAALFALLNALIDNPKPIVAVVNGIASGGGAMLALVCDARVAAESAEIALPEVNLGIASFIGVSLVAHVAGFALAADLVQTGRRMASAEALSRGLLTSVVPRAALDAEARRMAGTFVQKDPAAFAANKRWLNRSLKIALAEARLEHERHQFGER